MQLISIAMLLVAGISVGGTTATSMQDGFGAQIDEMRKQTSLNTSAIQEKIKIIHFEQQGDMLNIILSNNGSIDVEIAEIIDDNLNDADCGGVSIIISAGEKVALSCSTDDSKSYSAWTRSSSEIQQYISLYAITTNNNVLQII